MQKRYVRPRPWSAKRLPHNGLFEASILDADGKVICVMDQDDAALVVELENADHRKSVTLAPKPGGFRVSKNIFHQCQYRTRHRRVQDIGRQPKPDKK